jgi:hypothetical protein
MRTVHFVTVEFAAGKQPDHREFMFANIKQRDEFVKTAEEHGFRVVEIKTGGMFTAQEALIGIMLERAYEQVDNEDKERH